MKNLDAWVRGSHWRRTMAVALSLWIAAYVAFALRQAWTHDLELYRPAAILLYMAGLPLALFSIGYSYNLLSPRLRKLTWWLVGSLAFFGLIAIGVNQLVWEHQARKKATEAAAVAAAASTAIAAHEGECLQKYKGPNFNAYRVAECISDLSGADTGAIYRHPNFMSISR